MFRFLMANPVAPRNRIDKSQYDQFWELSQSDDLKEVDASLTYVSVQLLYSQMLFLHIVKMGIPKERNGITLKFCYFVLLS